MLVMFLALTLGYSEKVELDYTSSQQEYFSDQFQVTEDGLLLVNERKFLIGLKQDGEEAVRINVPVAPGAIMGGIANFAYLPKEKMFVLTILTVEPDQTRHYRVEFFDEFGRSLGHGYDFNRQNPEDVYFRQWIPFNGRIYVNVWNTKDFANRIDFPPVLQEISLIPVRGGYEIVYEGEGFSQQLGEPSTIGDNYKLRWLVDGIIDDTFLVLDQLQPRVWEYHLDGRRLKESRFYSLELTGREQPFGTQYKQLQDTSTTRAPFSTVDGFYAFGENHYLISYTRSTPFSGKLISCFQKLNRNLEPVGHPLFRSGAHLMGTMGNKAFAFLPGNDEGNQVEILEFKDFLRSPQRFVSQTR